MVCRDKIAKERVILKHYSIAEPGSKDAVWQSNCNFNTDMDNFTKLNEVEGMCKLIAFTAQDT